MRKQEIDKKCSAINEEYGTHLEREYPDSGWVVVKDINYGKFPTGYINYLTFDGTNEEVGGKLDAFKAGLELGYKLAEEMMRKEVEIGEDIYKLYGNETEEFVDNAEKVATCLEEDSGFTTEMLKEIVNNKPRFEELVHYYGEHIGMPEISIYDSKDEYEKAVEKQLKDNNSPVENWECRFSNGKVAGAYC